MLIEVDEEVLLGLELAQEVGGEHLAQVALLAVDLLLRIHLKDRLKVRIIVQQDFKNRLKTRRNSGSVCEIELHYFHK